MGGIFFENLLHQREYKKVSSSMMSEINKLIEGEEAGKLKI